MSSFTESVVEDAALGWLEGLGYAVVHGPAIAPREPGAERSGCGRVLLAQRLWDAPLARLVAGGPSVGDTEKPRGGAAW